MINCNNVDCIHNRKGCALATLIPDDITKSDTCTRTDCMYNYVGHCIDKNYHNTEDPDRCNAFTDQCDRLIDIKLGA